uniref:Uncharacterized protein n=1 Tax=Anguilla anguilla TaxID=7936 RepID=A0A0E9TAG0_ANGAN
MSLELSKTKATARSLPECSSYN